MDTDSRRQETIDWLVAHEAWLTLEQLSARRALAPAATAELVETWAAQHRAFCVALPNGALAWPAYQFDGEGQPRPVIKAILDEFGDVSDAWVLAAWFHFPSAWLVRRDERGAMNTAPRDALHNFEAVVRAAAMRKRGYIA